MVMELVCGRSAFIFSAVVDRYATKGPLGRRAHAVSLVRQALPG
jgi:hypothetical protein